MGKHSGRHAFREKINEMGYQLGDNEFQEAFTRFKDLADKKKQVFDEDIAALLMMLKRRDERIAVVSLQVYAGSKVRKKPFWSWKLMAR